MRLILIITLLLLLCSSSQAKQNDKPFAAVMLPEGRIAIATPDDEKKVKVINDEGHLLGAYINETGEGGLLMPWDMAASPDGWIYILDRAKAKVNVYDYDFKFQYSFGEKGTSFGQLKSPQSIALDRRGFIYVANNGNNRIEKFTIDGEHKGYLEPGGGEGDPDDFRYITAMNVAPSGELYVAIDSDEPQILRNIYIYNAQGDLSAHITTTKWGGFGKFSDICSLADGSILITDAPSDEGLFAGAVWHAGKEGSFIGKFVAWDPDLDRYYSPVESEVRDGQLYIFCSEGKCLVYSVDGNYERIFGF